MRLDEGLYGPILLKGDKSHHSQDLIELLTGHLSYL